jgi:DNA recombination protein RmuC
MQELIIFIIGAIVASLITIFIMKKMKNQTNPELIELKIRLDEKKDLANELQSVKEANTSLQNLQAESTANIKNLSQSLEDHKQEKKDLENQIRESQDSNKALSVEIRGFQEQQSATEERLKDEKERIDVLKSEFKVLSQNILEDKAKKMNEVNTSKINELLNPLNEKLKSFEDKVVKSQAEDRDRQTRFDEQVKNLIKMNEQLSSDASSLTNALKGDNKAMGDYGEVILRQVLDYSGLQKGIGYTEQGEGLGIKNEDGGHMKPDVLLHLPDEGYLVVDSKMSLKSYEACVNASESEVAACEKTFVQSVSNHIDNLHSKKYDQVLGRSKSPDYVLLFMPIEHSFHLATKNNSGLYDKAWSKKIILVSPSTLLATLRTLENIWKREAINGNALKIATEAGKLYDKFTGFVGDLEKVGKSLDAAQKDYGNAHKKLVSGNGNVVNRFESIRKLGAKANKALPAGLVEESGDDVGNE